MSRMLALLTAVVAAAALTLQLGIMIQANLDGDGSVGRAIWRFFGFFTLLTNLGVAAVAAAVALSPGSPLAGPRTRLAAVVSIALVGLVYSAALRHIWSPTGWQAVADHALHDVTPLLFVATWAFAGHGWLKWRDALWAIVPGLAYCVYALARGAADGWYAYWFLDPSAATALELARNIAVLSAALLALALLFTAADRWLARRRRATAA